MQPWWCDSEASPVLREQFSFQGLDAIAERIRRAAEDIGYLVVQDRTDRKQDETLGRFDLTEADAGPYLHDALNNDEDGPFGPSFDDREEDADEPPDDEEEEDDPDTPSWRPGADPVPMAELAEAALRWVKDIASRNTVGEEWRRYRVKVWSPKGHRLLDSGQFVCRNHNFDLELPPSSADERVAEMRIPPPSFEVAETQGAAKGVRALGDYYAQWGQIVLGSVGQLQGVNNAMLNRLHRQLQESRGQIDQLVAAILETRLAEVQLADERRADERSGDTRTVLAQQALQQLGDAAKAFLTAKGVHPEMADVLGSIGQSPELVATLTDPDVKALMNDPANLAALAGMLKQAAAQARAARQLAAQANPNQPGADQTAAS